ncbi:MAG: hypothetical protein AAGG38_08505 [Planctomycetota bacterium]
MKNVLDWIKLNPITVASAVVILLSVGFIGYILFAARPALQELATDEPQRVLSQIQGYSRQTIEVPPANADDPPEVRSGITINQATVSVLREIYGDLNRESQEIFDAALEINQPGHEPLYEGLFPSPPPGLGFPAKTRYARVLNTLLRDRDAAQSLLDSDGLAVPYLNAQPPMPQEKLQGMLDQQMDAMMESNAATAGPLSPVRQRQQRDEQQRELINELLAHAQSINLYADPDLGDALSPNPAFPLQIAALALKPEAPTASELWEGQFELWIMQDILRAIALANDVADQREHLNEQGQPVPSSVLNAPIKRLLALEVLPGYIGLHSPGATNELSGNPSVSSGASTYPPPAGGVRTNKPRETKLSDNFFASPTGRSSNSIYDVRHARLLVHADFKRLPEFFNALGRINLMTVLNTRIRAVDEYDLLNQRYLYGQGDIVEVEMIIESLWLREWTAELMPDDVKSYVGIDPPAEGAANPYGGNEFNPYNNYDPSLGGGSENYYQ